VSKPSPASARSQRIEEASMTRRFEGRAVIVTGAASGIGRQTAIAFAREGAHVVVADIDEPGSAATVETITGEGGTASSTVTDVADDDSVAAMVATCRERYGAVDVLHNNAYWAPLYRPLADTSPDEWDRTIAVTLSSVFYGCRHAIPAMIEQGGGVIVNTASVAGFLVGSPQFAAYMAAKGGVVQLTRSVAMDYGRHGIRCNAVCPGFIETPATAPPMGDAERVAFLTSKLLIGRPGQPGDIASAVLYLASDDSSFMTGQTLVVDGGRSIS
jgi:NAD(P)-dependent dehydrogenase (short-subunit alcohol dehydrogenase family)